MKNSSGSNQNRFAILGIDAPVISPDTNINEFKNRVVLSCVTPAEDTHEGKFVVLAEPIASGKIGRAFAAGVCACQINITDAEHKFADISPASTSSLESCDSGPAQILWQNGTSGVQWCIIRFGGSGGAAGVFLVSCLKTGGNAGSPTANCSYVYTVSALDGTELGTNMSPQCPRIPTCEYASVTTSAGLAYYNLDGDLVLYHVAAERPKTDWVKLQTKYSIDGTTQKFLVKYRDVLVLEAKDEDTDWTTVHTGDLC